MNIRIRLIGDFGIWGETLLDGAKWIVLVSRVSIVATPHRHAPIPDTACPRGWGEVCQEDWQANDEALETGERLLSAYRTSKDERIWIITEHDRSVTTLLLPDEY